MEEIKNLIEKLEENRAELDKLRFNNPENPFLLNADNDLCMTLCNLDKALEVL